MAQPPKQLSPVARERLRLGYLPRDLDTLILPYTMYDAALSPETRQRVINNLANPVLAPMRHGRLAGKMRNERAMMLYRAEFATNDIFANNFLDCYGNIQWVIAYAQAVANLRKTKPFAEYFDLKVVIEYPNMDRVTDWTVARELHFDILQIRIIDQLFSIGEDRLLQAAEKVIAQLALLNYEYQAELAILADDPVFQRELALQRRLWLNENSRYKYLPDYDGDDDEDEDQHQDGTDYVFTEEELSQSAMRTGDPPILDDIIDRDFEKGKITVRDPGISSRAWQRKILEQLAASSVKTIIDDDRIGRFVLNLSSIPENGLPIDDAVYSSTLLFMSYYLCREMLIRRIAVQIEHAIDSVVAIDDPDELIWVLQQYPSDITVEDQMLALLGQIPASRYLRDDLINLYRYYISNCSKEEAVIFTNRFHEFNNWKNMATASSFHLIGHLVQHEGMKLFTEAMLTHFKSLLSSSFPGEIFQRLPSAILGDSIRYAEFLGPAYLISRIIAMQGFPRRPKGDIRRIYYQWRAPRADAIKIYELDLKINKLYTAVDVAAVITQGILYRVEASFPVLRVLLPYERASEPAFRKFINYFFTSSFELTTTKGDKIGIDNAKYTRFNSAVMYILFVKYYYLTDRQPVVPYYYCTNDHFDFAHSSTALVKRINLESGVTMWEIPPVAHVRLFVLGNSDDILHAVDQLYDKDDKIVYDGFVLFTHYIHILPAGSTGRVSNIDSFTHFRLYDYDIADIDWLLRQRQ